jgi:hypothetical protein
VILSKFFQVSLEGIHLDFVSSPKLASPLHFDEGTARLVVLPWALLADSSAKRGLASGFRNVRSIVGGSASPDGQFSLHCVFAHGAASDHAAWWFCTLSIF